LRAAIRGRKAHFLAEFLALSPDVHVELSRSPESAAARSARTSSTARGRRSWRQVPCHIAAEVSRGAQAVPGGVQRAQISIVFRPLNAILAVRCVWAPSVAPKR
jgi:hypothetical protein